MEPTTLQFILYVVFIAGMFSYAALDGFDLGVGCLHLFTKTDVERRTFLNAIGPVWDGNSLWVIITAGTLLAAFPPAFSILLSSMYLPIVILVFGFILRGLAIEFRSKIERKRWRFIWDCVFSIASFGLSLAFGAFMGNLIHGIPLQNELLDKEQFHFFSFYPLLIGVFTTSLFMLHGGLYLHMKTEGELHNKIRSWLRRIIFPLFLVLWFAINIATFIFEPHMLRLISYTDFSFWLLLTLALSGILFIGRALKKGYDGYAFLSSFLIIGSLILSFALGTYPNIIQSTIDPIHNITIYNASSTPLTLTILFGMACAGIPLLFFYAIYIHKVFKGKVELDSMSY